MEHYDELKNYKIVHCNVCNKKFTKNRYNKIYCSKKCKSLHDYKNRKPISNYLIKCEDFDDTQLVEEMFQKLILCPKCKKPLSQYWKKGKRYTKHGENKELYTCLRCGYNFTLFSLSFGMQHSEDDILRFIKLREKGWTPYKIVSHKKMNISMMTSFRWDKKYKSKIKKIDRAFWERLLMTSSQVAC